MKGGKLLAFSLLIGKNHLILSTIVSDRYEFLLREKHDIPNVYKNDNQPYTVHA